MSQKYIGLPVGTILDEYQVNRNDIILTDEPPGKLNAISFKLFGKRSKSKEVTVRLKGSHKLFDAERAWSLETIRQAIVARVDVKEVD